MSTNAEVADRLEELADRLEARGVSYKPQAYQTAAANVRAYPESVETLAADGVDGVGAIEGVGESIAGKITEYVREGHIEALEAERERLPVDMEALTAVEGIGPKRAAALYEALEVRTLDDLEAAAEAGEIREVEGFGEKTEGNIRENVAFAREARKRSLLSDARPVAEAALDHLDGIDAVERCDVAGSLRRWRPTIGDVDVLAASEDRTAVVEAFTDWERATETIEAGEDKASVRADGHRVDLRAVAPAEFGSALQYFTGSREHNIRLRSYAIEQGYKINEYGVFDVAERRSAEQPEANASGDVSDVEDPDAGQRVGERVAGETEESVYAALDLPWMAPELREDTGEIAAARRGELPDLLVEDDLRGELHVHTTDSDGGRSVEQMVADAAAFGHEYVAVTDHAAGPGIVGDIGLDGDDLLEQAERVREAGADADVTAFAGVEANVDAEGQVTTPDDVLAALDLVVASPHSALDTRGERATERLVRAVEHPETDVLGHPSGRLLGQRSGLEFDVERVATAAAEHGVALEVNSHPSRLDLDGGAVKTAVEAGATVAINTDAHSPAEFRHRTYGVHTARRGWAEAGDVLNARDAEGVRAFLDE